jgi:DNA repair protein RadC
VQPTTRADQTGSRLNRTKATPDHIIIQFTLHNHPSGHPAPSEVDIRLTHRLADGARILQINMLDHVIVGQPIEGRPGYFSFKEAGMI